MLSDAMQINIGTCVPYPTLSNPVVFPKPANLNTCVYAIIHARTTPTYAFTTGLGSLRCGNKTKQNMHQCITPCPPRSTMSTCGGPGAAPAAPGPAFTMAPVGPPPP